MYNIKINITDTVGNSNSTNYFVNVTPANPVPNMFITGDTSYIYNQTINLYGTETNIDDGDCVYNNSYSKRWKALDNVP